MQIAGLTDPMETRPTDYPSIEHPPKGLLTAATLANIVKLLLAVSLSFYILPQGARSNGGREESPVMPT